VWLTVDLIEVYGKHLGPIRYPLLCPKAVECVGARIDELVGTTGHAQTAAGALVGPEGQPGPAERDPV
jgi:hypothetical protein